MDWQTYEDVVKQIYGNLGAAHGVEIVCHGRNCKRVGKSGVPHQIDVLTSHSDGVHTYQTAIECKYWNEKVDKDVAMKVHEIVRDLNLNQGVVVSRRGFTPDAIAYSQHVNLRLVELGEHKGYLKEGVFTKLYANVVVTTTKLQDVLFLVKQGTAQRSQFESFFTSVNDMMLHGKNGSSERLTNLIVPFLNSKVLLSNSGVLEEDEVLFEEPTVIENVKNSKTLLATGLKLSGYKVSYTVLDPDYHRSTDWLRMRLLYEKKELVYSLHGDLRILEHPKIELEAFPGHEHKLEFALRKKEFKVLRGLGGNP